MNYALACLKQAGDLGNAAKRGGSYYRIRSPKNCYLFNESSPIPLAGSLYRTIFLPCFIPKGIMQDKKDLCLVAKTTRPNH